ncbi:hypothetical protein QAD02_020754 [Eretmocerus hayati]|uniref:Uncharacterized protein n=1 Tax=Eretmocerus hayati TaxID=131215 RepID=A0ACC2PPL5_9HYME|nr:hypothetical protein QAD02_020754 [Eretmocerus hayati]
MIICYQVGLMFVRAVDFGSPVEDGAGVGIHASIIHQSTGSTAGGGVGGIGVDPGPRAQSGPVGSSSRSTSDAAAIVNTSIALQNPNSTSTPQQEPTYVNL